MRAFILCPMCRASIENSQNAAEMSDAVNSAILVLLIPTLAIIALLARLIFKYRHSSEE